MKSITDGKSKVYCYFSTVGMMNTYIVWDEDTREALLIDPGIFEEGLFEILEGNSLEVTAALITHCHEDKFLGIKTLPKIYHNVELYGGDDRIYDMEINNIKASGTLALNGFTVQAQWIAGHHPDAMVYTIGGLIFTGDMMSAGGISLNSGDFRHKLLCDKVRDLLEPRDDHNLILPLFGPPTTVGVERVSNPFLVEGC